MKKCISFENNYSRVASECVNEGDVFMAISIDGYPEDDNEEGEVIAEVIMTEHGDIVISWRDNSYRYDNQVTNLIEESKALLRDSYYSEYKCYDESL